VAGEPSVLYWPAMSFTARRLSADATHLAETANIRKRYLAVSANKATLNLDDATSDTYAIFWDEKQPRICTNPSNKPVGIRSKNSNGMVVKVGMKKQKGFIVP